MKRWIQLLLFAGAVFAVSLNQTLMAQATDNAGQRQRGQGRRQRDPATMLAERMDRYRQALEITADDDWKAVQPLIEKVLTAQAETRVADFRGMRGQRNRRGRDAASADTNTSATATRPAAVVNPEADALRQAIDSKASSADIATKLAKLRDAQKIKQAALDTARDNLRKVLSVRQEAIAVEMGLLR